MFKKHFVLIISLVLSVSSLSAMKKSEDILFEKTNKNNGQYKKFLAEALNEYLKTGNSTKLINLLHNARDKDHYVYGDAINPIIFQKKDGSEVKIYLGHDAIKTGNKKLLRAFLRHIEYDVKNEEGLTMIELCDKLKKEGKLKPEEYNQWLGLILTRLPEPEQREDVAFETPRFRKQRAALKAIKKKAAPAAISDDDSLAKEIKESFQKFEEESASEESSLSLEGLPKGEKSKKSRAKDIIIKK